MTQTQQTLFSRVMMHSPSESVMIVPEDTEDDWNFCIPSSPPQSKSIPIRHHIRRTISELQLCEDEEMADYRDYRMFQRIVTGMMNDLQQQEHHTPARAVTPSQADTADTLGNVIRTRDRPVQATSCFHDSTENHFLPEFDEGPVHRLDSFEYRRATSIEDSNEFSDDNDAIFDMDL